MWPWLIACRPHPGCHSPSMDPPPAPAGAGLAVSVAPISARRDLVARVRPPGAEVRWQVDGADAGIRGLRVPAHRVRPGQTWTAVASAGGRTARDRATVPTPLGGNVLVVVLDDVGVDQVAAYGLNDLAPPTPTLSALA